MDEFSSSVVTTINLGLGFRAPSIIIPSFHLVDRIETIFHTGSPQEGNEIMITRDHQKCMIYLLDMHWVMCTSPHLFTFPFYNMMYWSNWKNGSTFDIISIK